MGATKLKVDGLSKTPRMISAREFEDSLKLTMSTTDYGRHDSLRYTILSLVVEEKYERAADELDVYIEQKNEYPLFAPRSKRYVQHSKDLINAVKAKRDFRGRSALTMSKHQELLEKVTEHFNELKTVLRKIEQIEMEVRMDDFRSTTWVIRAVCVAVFILFVTAFMIQDFVSSTGSLWLVIESQFESLGDWVYKKFFSS